MEKNPKKAKPPPIDRRRDPPKALARDPLLTKPLVERITSKVSMVEASISKCL